MLKLFTLILLIGVLATTPSVIRAFDDDSSVYVLDSDFDMQEGVVVGLENVNEVTPFFAPIAPDETTGQFLNRVYNAQLTYIDIYALERNIFALQEQIDTYVLATYVNEREKEDFYARQQLAQAQMLNQAAVTSYVSGYVQDYHETLFFTDLNDILQARAAMMQVLTEHGLTYANHQLQVANIMGPRIINIEHMDIDELTESLALASVQITTVAQGQDYGGIPTTWPVLGNFTSGFGFRTDPISGQLAFHSGIDIEAPIGTPIYAWFNGTVIDPPQNGGFGRQVIIRQGDMQVRYAHMDAIEVYPGQKVSQGQRIGTVGDTGRSTGPHLHLGLYLQGVAVNPEYIFTRR
jgi:murein DD-endopeptidase MepM/ murein hydrolase activator NlpD